MKEYAHLTEFSREEWEAICELRRSKQGTLSPYAAKDADAVYAAQYPSRDFRTNYGKDVDGILNNVFYARFGDKTQVHSFYKNDDVTRRSLHVQYVSRIARSIGEVLRLNLDLIEAIAIGHDIGHTPFGHKGEKYLSELYQQADKKFFNHNAHSVRVLKDISKRSSGKGLSLQTLDGILSHNGELLQNKLEPTNLRTFAGFEEKFTRCYTEDGSSKTHVANTLEGCLVRLCDMIAYVGKDRQDLWNVRRGEGYDRFEDDGIGTTNADMIRACSVNIIRCSLGKNCIMMDSEVSEALEKSKNQNDELIYKSPFVNEKYEIVKKMFTYIFEAVLKDLRDGSDFSFIRRNFQNAEYLKWYRVDIELGKYTPADLAVDYIASMTDDYLVDLAYKLGFPDKIEYVGYFDAK